MRSVILAALAALAVSPPLHAQCTGSGPVRAVCDRALDAVKVFHPAAGLLVSGGNPVLGSAAGLGGLGHGFVALRATAFDLTVPNPDTTSAGAIVDGLVAAPVVEAGAGLAGGMVALDAIVSATLLPTDAIDKLRVDTGAVRVGDVALGIGFGARLAVGRGTFPIPAVSVAVMRRTVPRVAYGRLPAASLAPGDAFEFDTDLQATNIRLVAGYRLSLVDVAAGLGFDRYTSRAELRYYDNPPLNTVATVTLNPRNSRQLVFVNASVRLSVVVLAAELGYQTGKDQGFAAGYPFDPAAGHVFGGVGVRLGF